MRGVPLVVALAVAAAGCGGADHANRHARLALTVSLGDDAMQGNASQLNGSLHGADKVSGVPVVIEADAWPRDGRFTAVAGCAPALTGASS